KADVSGDGRWRAYQSGESGAPQVYVRPFPDVNAGRWQISATGGSRPAWARNTHELFYVDGNGAMMAVTIQPTLPFTASNPTKLFDARYVPGTLGRAYDVTADGQRFIMIKEGNSLDQKTAPASMVVVLNWVAELKTRLSSAHP